MEPATKPIVITLYYDIGSLYSYTAFSILKRYEQTYWTNKVKVALEPVLVGAIFKATGNSPPVALPAKRAYGIKDMQYLSAYTGIKFTTPSEIPANTLKVMRLLTAIKLQFPHHLSNATRGLFKGYWCLGASMQSEKQLMDLMTTELGFDGITAQKLMAASTGADVKENLRKSTEKAIEMGLFGVPTMAVETTKFPPGYLDNVGGSGDAAYQIFFGSDKLPMIADFLNLPWYGALREVGEDFLKGQAKM